jgi:hypothetical protein
VIENYDAGAGRVSSKVADAVIRFGPLLPSLERSRRTSARLEIPSPGSFRARRRPAVPVRRSAPGTHVRSPVPGRAYPPARRERGASRRSVEP